MHVEEDGVGGGEEGVGRGQVRVGVWVEGGGDGDGDVGVVCVGLGGGVWRGGWGRRVGDGAVGRGQGCSGRVHVHRGCYCCQVVARLYMAPAAVRRGGTMRLLQTDQPKHRRLIHKTHHWSGRLRKAFIVVRLVVRLVVVWLRHKLVVVRVRRRRGRVLGTARRVVVVCILILCGIHLTQIVWQGEKWGKIT